MFTTHRRMICRATYFAQGKTITRDEKDTPRLQHITYFMDDLMIATLDGYDQHTHPVALAPPVSKSRSAKHKPARR